MDERSCAEAVAAFFREDVAIDPTYAYPISTASGPLPDAVVLVAQKRVTAEVPAALAELGLIQVWVRLFPCEVSIMVGVDPNTEGAADAADAQLRGFGATVEGLIWTDPTLGGRVPLTSPDLTFDYSTPFVRREDGTTGRLAVFSFTVAEAIPSPE